MTPQERVIHDKIERNLSTYFSRTAEEAIRTCNELDQIARQQAREISEAIVEKMTEDWPHIRLYLACSEARQWLIDGAPGRAFEVLNQALLLHDKQSNSTHANPTVGD